MNQEEFKKYNPLNLSPDHLFLPPTSPLKREFQYLIRELTGALEARGKNILRVGTELEIFFFSPDADPYTAPDMDYNPNYSDGHLNKFRALRKFIETMQTDRPSEFMRPIVQGRIFLEIRTQPQNVREYPQTIQRLGDELSRICSELSVLPVVYSQHIHLSLREKLPSIPPSISPHSSIPNHTRLRYAFGRINPLVLLPEEWHRRGRDPYIIKSSGKRSKDSGWENLDHPEFRKLSSEYAHDPTLNLLLCLYGMYAGCFDQSMYSRAEDKDTYLDSVKIMGKDPKLVGLFGQSTLSTLAKIVSQYPAVSSREITVDQVKL